MSNSKFTDADELFRALLREIRVDKGVTQVQLAERLGSLQSYVSKYETGERRLDFVETTEVCDALGIDLKAFVELYRTKLAKSKSAAQKATP